MSGSVLNSAGRVIFQLGYQISPIILTNGIAANMPGGMLPIVTILDTAGLIFGALSGSAPTLDDSFAHFQPLPGTELVSNQIAEYPFANQAVAANAIIKNARRVSLLMKAPVRGAGAYTSKLITFSALEAILDQHHAMGGTYTVATPALLFTNCLLGRVADVGGEGKQAQVNWQWDFIKPLLTQAQATAAMNTTMAALSNQTPTDGATSGVAATVGNSSTGAGAATIPTASNLTGATVGTAPVVPVSSTNLPAPAGA
jgi:hypothetical protein